jgi:lipopolysaccharide biosynthesis glycosyltransferase
MIDRPELHLLCAANPNYAMPMTVALTSVVRHCRTKRPLSIHLLVNGFDASLKRRVESSILRNSPSDETVTIRWYDFDARRFDSYFHKAHVGYISAEAYSRMVADEYLPAGIGKVAYLDCDLVVRADIAGLVDSLPDDQLLGAVPNVRRPYVSTPFDDRPIVFDFDRLGIAPNARYFQSGVLVLNMPLWRSRDTTRRLMDYLASNHERVIFHDQGVMNAVLHAEWFRLDQRWNQVGTVLHPELWKEPAYTRDEWRISFADPFVVHYDGAEKPWKPDFASPRGSYFFDDLERTDFAGSVPVPSCVRLERLIGTRALWHAYRARRLVRRAAGKLKGIMGGRA